jgi:hypothetical protein
MDRKARYNVYFGPSMRHSTASGWPTGPISQPGHTHRQPGRVDLEFRASAAGVKRLRGAKSPFHSRAAGQHLDQL